VRITFSHSLLETIFCLKFIDNAPLNLTQKLAKESCLSQFACPKKKLVTYTRVRKALLYHVLFSEPRFLHYVFVRIFYPKDHSKEVSNEIALEVVYRLMPWSFFTTCIELPTWISIPPYLMAISSPRYFSQFKVPLDLEECSTQPILIISANSLKTLCFYKTKSRGWQHLYDLNLRTYLSLMSSLTCVFKYSFLFFKFPHV